MPVPAPTLEPGDARLATMLRSITSWTPRRRAAAVAAAVVTALAIGLPTDVIPNPVFGRPVPVTAWSYPVLALTAILSGLLAATYVREASTQDEPAAVDSLDPPARRGVVGGALSYFAVGCPVCNKLVVVAIGTVGAREWFEPIQPYLAVLSIGLLFIALRARLRSSVACPLPRRAM